MLQFMELQRVGYDLATELNTLRNSVQINSVPEMYCFIKC